MNSQELRHLEYDSDLASCVCGFDPLHQATGNPCSFSQSLLSHTPFFALDLNELAEDLQRVQRHR